MAPTPSWTDATRWYALLEGTDCPLCGRESGPNVVASLETSIVTVDENVGVAGYCCIILKDHRVELHALSKEEGAAFMHDVQRVSSAVQSITGAIKINYEVHGNVVPHVHMHIVPRYPHDDIERTGKSFGQLASNAYRGGEFEVFQNGLRNALTMLALFLVIGCGEGPRPAEEPAIGADTAVLAADTASGPKACDLLTNGDITTAIGMQVNTGVVANDYMGVSQCRFDKADGTQAVMVSLHQQGKIENYTKVPGASAVTGIGEAAVWNPETNQFAFKRGDAVASISFLFSPARQEWGKALARKALDRMDQSNPAGGTNELIEDSTDTVIDEPS